MFDYQSYYLKVHQPGWVGKTRPVNHGVKLPTRWRQLCSECGTRTPLMLSCFCCAKVLCGNCRISSPSEFAVVICNKKGVCKSCYDLIQLKDQESSSSEYDGGSDDDSEEVTSEAEDRMSSTELVSVNFPSNIRNENCFASLVAHNIKLVYLKKSLVEELMKEHPECRESKVLGSFVRVKTDPRDYFRTKYHQLARVQGVIQDYVNGEFFLRVLSNYVTRDIPVSQISDDDFTEEECEDLRQDVANCHLLRRPTVLELQHKARDLQEDITKHWVRKELVTLQNHVERANETGSRSEKLVYLEQIREQLEKACEQERLLKQVPEVIADWLRS